MKVSKKQKIVLYDFYVKRKFYKVLYKVIGDKNFIRLKYRFRLGKRLNLASPRTFNEKIQWLKLYYRKDLLTQCADKYEVRKYVKQKIGSHILTKLYFDFDKVDDIDIRKLPGKFVLKVNHGCGQNIICFNKAEIDWKFAFYSLNIYMASNHFYHGREWAYKNIRPRIICEQLLEENGDIPYDYKLFCFNGAPKFIQVDVDRFQNHKRLIFDLDWNPIDVRYVYKKGKNVSKPATLKKMISYAATLSQGFPFVRVDFFSLGNSIYFGEMTFYPESGAGNFIPESFDYFFGSYLNLPHKEKKCN